MNEDDADTIYPDGDPNEPLTMTMADFLFWFMGWQNRGWLTRECVMSVQDQLKGPFGAQCREQWEAMATSMNVEIVR